MPAIIVNVRSFSTGCADPTACCVEAAETGLQQRQGTHGSFSRTDTRAIMGAIGPAFRRSVRRSEADDAGRVTAAMVQTVGDTRYLDAAGYPGSTLGVPAGFGPGGQIPGAEGIAEASRPD